MLAAASNICSSSRCPNKRRVISIVMRVFLAHYEDHLLDRTVLYPGVREVLSYFRGKRRLVVSNKIHRLTLAVLRGLGVAGEFDAIFGGDSAAEKKPHPAMLQSGVGAISNFPGQRLDGRRWRYRYPSRQARRRDHLRRDLRTRQQGCDARRRTGCYHRAVSSSWPTFFVESVYNSKQEVNYGHDDSGAFQRPFYQNPFAHLATVMATAGRR